jgi:hypothetical protein
MSNITPKELIICGIFAGAVVEFAMFLTRNERYKNIFKYVRTYPGVTIATTTAVLGLGFMYGELIKQRFSGSSTHQ